MIIGLSGHIGSGKDTVGQMISHLPAFFWKVQVWEIKKFAGKLKEIASMLTGIPVHMFENQEFKNTLLGPEWDQWRVTWKHGDEGPGSQTFKTEEDAIKFIEDGFEDSLEEIRAMGLLTFEQMTVRQFLQKLGTEGLRNGLHTDVWVNALFSDLKPESNWIITDVRFPNEAVAVKKAGGILVRIERPDKLPVDKGIARHPSETALDGWNFDYVIQNDGTIDELREKVEGLLSELKIT